VHFKFAIGLLVPYLVLFSTNGALSGRTLDAALIRTLLIIMCLGSVLSIIGVLLRGTRVQPLIVGYSIEICGLIFLFTGPFLLSVGYTYAAMQVGSSLVSAGLCYAISAALLARFIDVYFHTLESKQPGDPLISKD
jgi:uncharacterized membrane protein